MTLNWDQPSQPLYWFLELFGGKGDEVQEVITLSSRNGCESFLEHQRKLFFHCTDNILK